MRNNVVLYNSPSLELIKDDLRDLFVKHADFLQKYQNLASQASVNEGPLSELESRQIRQYSMGFIAGSLSEMSMPIWTYHANLYTSGLVDEAGMARLNSIASGYMVEVFDYVVGKNNYENSAMGMALRSEDGFVKLLFDKNSRKLLGAHIIGEEASNMIHMLIAFMTMSATLEDIVSTIYIHPALPEVVRNAARKALLSFDNEGLFT